LLGFRV